MKPTLEIYTLTSNSMTMAIGKYEHRFISIGISIKLFCDRFLTTNKKRSNIAGRLPENSCVSFVDL